MILARPISVRLRSFAAAPLGLLLVLGCAGGQKPADTPEEPMPVLEEEASEQEEVPPSSPEVKAAIEKIKQEQFADAETILAKATQETPEDAQAAFLYGVALEGVGKADKAEGEYRRAIGLMPKLIESFGNLSALLLSQEKYQEALQVADAGLEQAPQDAPLLANRALALDMMESPEAVGAYEALLEVAPKDNANRFNYAVVLFLNQRKVDAQAELARIKTREMSLLSDMEKLYLEMKDPKGCVAMWDGVIAAEKSAKNLSHRGRCKLMAGDKSGGEADLRAAIGVDSRSSIAHYYLGKLLEKDGKAAEAKKHFTQAAQASDEFGKAAQAELRH